MTWVDEGYTADDMVRFLESRNMEDSAAEFLSKEIDAIRGPQLKAQIIRSRDKDKLCISMNHMLCDAAGFKEYLYLLCNIYSNSDETWNLHRKSMGNRMLKQIFKTFSIRDKLKILLGKDDMVTIDSIQFGLDGDRSNPFIEKRFIPKEQFYALKVFAKQYGATVNDLIVAAYLRVLYQLYGRTIVLSARWILENICRNAEQEVFVICAPILPVTSVQKSAQLLCRHLLK